MARLILSRLKRVAPNPELFFSFLAIFLLIEGFFWYLESKNIPIGAVFPFGPGGVCLFLASVLHGVFRVIQFHPIWQNDYRIWLESTPWTSRKPLPLGPVELCWEDGLILGPLILASAILPEPHAMRFLCAFLLSHLAMLVVTLWRTRIWAIGYLTAFGLGLAVWLWHQSIACLLVSTLVYLIAYEGLRRGLEQFPWKPRKLPGLKTELMNRGSHDEPCGWPYDTMMRDILNDQGISRTDVVLGCTLGTWWLFVVSSFMPDPLIRERFLTIVFGFSTLIILFRLLNYTVGYQSPITLGGRIRTFRWIIPGYDQVFVAPICTILAGSLSFALLQASNVPLYVCLLVATGMTVLVALLTPPRLRHWRLTGQHRIVCPHATRDIAAFVKVG